MVTLYDEVESTAGIKTAVTVFYQRVLADPALAPWFAEVDLDRLRSHQRAFLIAMLGGPDLFSGREIAEAHAGLNITDEAFDRLVSHLTTTLRDLGVTTAAVARVGRRLETLREAVVKGGPGGVDGKGDLGAEDADGPSAGDGDGPGDDGGDGPGGAAVTPAPAGRSEAPPVR